VSLTQQTIETRPAPPGGPWERLHDYRLITDWNTTPGKLRIARLILVIGILLAGSVAGLAGYARVEATGQIAAHLEPLNANVTTLYRSLADADATVAAAFLSGDAEPPELRTQYEQDWNLAAGLLAQAAAQTGGQTGDEPGTVDRIADINKQLALYTGYVERVRANNRQGNAAAARAYLGLASELMRNHILPQAEGLQRQQASRLDDAYGQAGSLPIVALTAGAVSLAGLIWAQVFVFRRTHRVMNLGLVAASTAVVAGLLWWMSAGAASAAALTGAHRHSQAVSGALGPAQIAALQARAIEANRLVSSTGPTEEDFRQQIQLARSSLGDAQRSGSDQNGLAEVQAAVEDYSRAHGDVQKRVEAGADANDAVNTAAARFKTLDQTISTAIDRERAVFGDDIQHAQSGWLTSLPIGTGLLALAAAVGVALGIHRRLEEYR
jgi:hypothetical protein